MFGWNNFAIIFLHPHPTRFSLLYLLFHFCEGVLHLTWYSLWYSFIFVMRFFIDFCLRRWDRSLTGNHVTPHITNSSKVSYTNLYCSWHRKCKKYMYISCSYVVDFFFLKRKKIYLPWNPTMPHSIACISPAERRESYICAITKP